MAKMTLDEFVRQLQAALGADLRSVAVYGSAAAGEQHAGKSDTNILVVVDSLSPERLAAASAAVAAWTEGNTAPLMVIETDISSSAIPSNKISMSSTLSIATPALPTSEAARG